MIKAVILDIDGTLTDGVSWLKITELLGASVSEHERIFREFLNQELTYAESKRQLIGLWQATGNANQTFLINIFSNWDFKHDARSLIDYCNEQHYLTVLITGSVDLFAEQIARKLDAHAWYANTQLVWDDKGNLIDFHYERDQATKKLEQFYDFLGNSTIKPEECIVIGDGDNDIKLFEITKHGIAAASKDEGLLKEAWKAVNDLSQIRDILQEAIRE
jgi:phosphoserine phosphatase